ASEECQGRGIDTEGINKAADYIVEELKKAGLKAGGKDGSWFQPFSFGTGTFTVEGTNTLTLRGPQGQSIELPMGKDYQVLPMSGVGKASAPVIFAGYGVTAAEADYDDFKGVDATGKIVVVLRRVPRWNNDATPFAKNQDAYSALATKIASIERANA